MTGNSDNILEINSIEVMYDSVISALHDVSLNVPKGKIVALLGGNGAGKSTTLKSISTMLAAERGKVTKGSIIYDGTEVKNQNPYEMVSFGNGASTRGKKMLWSPNRRRKYNCRGIFPQIIKVTN
jgi:branched-chain amino acid transport system ATP-binding protein